MNEYSKTYEIRWSDLDANGHVNYSAYIDTAGDLRYQFFTEHNFGPEKFADLGIAPIYTSIHADFLREIRMGETMIVTFSLSGLSPSGERWKVHHDFLKSNRKKAVNLDLEGTILNLITRKPALLTPDLLQTFNLVPRSSGFEIMPEMRWSKQSLIRHQE